MVRIVPRETKFFDMFNEMASNLTDGAKVLRDLLGNYEHIDARVSNIKDIEHRGDDMTHGVFVKLNQTFITPFDREDIHRLASSLDDVLDFINSAADRIMVYKIKAPPSAAFEIAKVIVRQAEALERGVSMLEKNQKVLEHLVEVNRLENEADRISRDAIGKLFEEERDPIVLIKHKELIEILEMATDKAEDVANVLETIVLKSA
jgi:uncharacterized protein